MAGYVLPFAGRLRSLRLPIAVGRRWREATAVAGSLTLLALVIGAPPAGAAAPVAAKHEITANWVGTPAPTSAPFGSVITGEWHINTNGASDPFAHDPVPNVRATLTLTNGVFVSIPAVCKTKNVTPVSSISANGSTLLCNVGTVAEGTATVIQAPVRVSGQNGGNLTASGSVTSDAATGPPPVAAPPPLPITYNHGMDLSLSQAPGQNYQGFPSTSRTGGTRTFIQINFSLILSSGSRPGPASYTFPLAASANIAGATNGLQYEGCVPLGSAAASTGQPFSATTATDRTNFPTCSISGSGVNYQVTASNLTYTLINTPTNDSLGQPLSGTGAYIASGTLQFSIPTPVTQLTNFVFNAAGAPDFTFTDGVTSPDDPSDNIGSATLVPQGAYSNSWAGDPTFSRTAWDANLFVSAGTSDDAPLPIPGINSFAELFAASAAGTPVKLPLYMQGNDKIWQGYTGAGGPQAAGMCEINQNPVFIPRSADGGGLSGDGTYVDYPTARYFYTTAAVNPKTETCGDASPGPRWTEVFPATGTSLTDPRITTDSLLTLPAGVTAVKMTWNPATDHASGNGETFLRVFGTISDTAPVTGDGWTIGTFNAPPGANPFPGYPTLNGYVNASTLPAGTIIPGSTYAIPPNGANGIQDAFRLQGAQGTVTKVTPQTTAEPGVPVTYNLTAKASLAITSPPNQTFPVVDTLPSGMTYVVGSGSPTPVVTTNGSGQQVLTFTFTNVPANVAQNITYQATTAANSTIAPGTSLTNTAVISVPGDQRPASTPGRTATATVVVPNSSSTQLGKSVEANVLSFYGDSSAWDLTVNSQDPVDNPYTDTIDILPYLGDGRGTTIDGTYTITGVTPPAAGDSVYYTTAPPASLSTDPRKASNGGTPGSIAGNTVGWSTTPVAHPTAIRIIAGDLAPGATQVTRIAFSTPAGSSCATPAAADNKPGQLLVNSAGSFAGHTRLPMLSSASTAIGDCYALDLKKYVLRKGGDPTSDPTAPGSDYHDANAAADFQQYAVGDTVPYKIVVTNKGTATLTNIAVTDPLISACNTTIAALAAGASQTVSCSATAKVGTTVNTATASVTPPEGPPLKPTDPAGIVVPDPYHVTKVSAPATGSAVAPGDIVKYTVTITEPASSAAPFLNPSFTDDLTAVLDDSTYQGDAAASSGAVTVTGNTVTWKAPTIMPGQTITVTYSVKVSDPDTGDHVLKNTVQTPPGEANCPVNSTDPLCTSTVTVRSFSIAKTADVAKAKPGDTVTYTIKVTNTGAAAYTAADPASFSDNLTAVLDDATGPTGINGGATYDAPLKTLNWAGALPIKGTATITYQVTVKAPDTGDNTLDNTVVTPPGSGGDCPTGSSPAACSANVLVQSFTVSKVADLASARPGDVVTYTIKITNTGRVDYTTGANAASYTDDLTAVLDDATGPTAITGGAIYDPATKTLSWTGPLAVGASSTVSYQVTVRDPAAGNHSLDNSVVTPPGSGGDCPTGSTRPACTVTVPVQFFTVAKKADTATAKPGGVVTYTITVHNTSAVDYTAARPAQFSDSLTAVLDDATGPTAITGGAVFDAATQNLSWSGALAAGATATITYQVTVKSPNTGDNSLDNTVLTPPSSGGDCPANTTRTACTAQVLVQSFRAVKVADTTSATPGSVITYTITLTNTGKVPYTTGANAASYTDDLTAVLDDASGPTNITGGATFASPMLSFSTPLPVGGTATVTYQLTVRPAGSGDGKLLNSVVTPPGSGANCPNGSTDPSCTVQLPGRSFSVVKTVDVPKAHPGDVVTYTIKVSNTGLSNYTTTDPASYTDDLTAVLDDAGVPTNLTGGLTYAAATKKLSWSGALAVGASLTFSYQVTVRSPDTGNNLLVNQVLTPPGSGGSCAAGSTIPGCTTTTPVQSFELTKVADVPAAKPGDTVTYTIQVRNTGQVDYTTGANAASFTDDLSAVLDDASAPSNITGGATFNAPVLSWSGPLAVGATATITYQVKVGDPDSGDHTLKNTAVPAPGIGGSCPAAGSQPNCSVLIPVQSFSVMKTADTLTAHAGDVITYTIKITNTGQVDYTTGANAASYTDDLSAVLDDTSAPSNITGGATYTAPVLSWTGPLAIGASATVTYQVTVKNPDTGDNQLNNTVLTPPGSGGDCPSGSARAACSVSIPVQSYQVSKTASVSTAKPGQTVTYTIKVVNTGQVAYTTGANAASFTDNLSAVLDDATYNNDADNGATYTAPVLSWSGSLAVGATATITYTVTVNTPDVGDKLMINPVVTPPGSGANCPSSTVNPVCKAVVPIQTYSTVKTTTSTTVTPGGKVVYSITVTNTGRVPYTTQDPASLTDDLTQVLDDATYNDDADHGATYTTPKLSWSGPLPVGEKIVITYSVTIHSPDTGDKKLHNTVITPPEGGCPNGSTDPACTVNIPGAALHIVKSASVSSARPGQKIIYTIKISNTGQVAYTAAHPAVYTDDLTRVLDDAVYNGDATGPTTYTAPKLTWSAPLAVGETATITYSVTVRSPDPGDKFLDNVITTPPGEVSNCPAASTLPGCRTRTPVQTFTIAKVADSPTAIVGQKVTYTITVTNTGQVAYTGGTPAEFDDDLSRVLDDATYNNDATNHATYAAPVLSWKGALAVGATLTIRYSVTFTGTHGDHSAVNVVTTPPGSGGNCQRTGSVIVGLASASLPQQCAVTIPVASFTVAKTASTASTSVGQTVRYTITVTNTGKVPFTAAHPAALTDDLTDVLDDATYNNDADGGATYRTTQLSWSGPLAVGAQHNITYSVTARNTGNNQLRNTVTTTGDANCPPGNRDPRCSTNTPKITPPPVIPPSVNPPPLAYTGVPAVPQTIFVALIMMLTGGIALIYSRRRRGLS